MALASASPLSINPLTTLSSRRRPPKPPIRPIVCMASESRGWRAVVSTALAAAVISSSGGAMADLNKYEADIRGEFGIGSAAQFGSADLKKTVHVNENFRRSRMTKTSSPLPLQAIVLESRRIRGDRLPMPPSYPSPWCHQICSSIHLCMQRRANFTSADMRESNFSGSTFTGAYLEKAVAFRANFSGADFSDTLMDRMVLNEANLTNAVLVRSVLTRSDLGGATIVGADFSDAVLDLPQKQALCKYASGTNPTTGVSTRTSLGCGNSRRNAYGSPSSPLLSAPPPKLLDRNGFCDESTGLCDAPK